MGRPPCCDKIGVKKGPWTPEEDIVLVTYIQEHGPRNWRAVPSNAGLPRCSKSCRFRWTNYLRPGIKRGNFTEQEEKIIIHLQALLGNRWATISSYLPQRTDNDVKNYWNTHLRKKLGKVQEHDEKIENGSSSSDSQSISKGKWERRLQTDIHMAKQALCEALSLNKNSSSQSLLPMAPQNKPIQTSTYVSSAENIAHLLKNWNKTSPKICQPGSSETTFSTDKPSLGLSSCPSEGPISTAFAGFNPTNSEFSVEDQGSGSLQGGMKTNLETQMPLSLLQKWLFDDAAAQGQDGDFVEMALGETAVLF